MIFHLKFRAFQGSLRCALLRATLIAQCASSAPALGGSSQWPVVAWSSLPNATARIDVPTVIHACDTGGASTASALLILIEATRQNPKP